MFLNIFKGEIAQLSTFVAALLSNNKHGLRIVCPNRCFINTLGPHARQKFGVRSNGRP